MIDFIKNILKKMKKCIDKYINFCYYISMVIKNMSHKFKE